MKDCSYIVKKNISETSLWENMSPPLLEELTIELTERCNNKCIHCYINLPADDSRTLQEEMTTNQVKRVIEEAASLGCINVRFTGGEPLLREDFDDIYVFTRKKGLKVKLLTNATLITDDRISLFTQIPPLEPIEITLYGMSRASYEAVSRTTGSFNKAWMAIDMLSQSDIPFILKSVSLPPNRGELDEMADWAKGLPGNQQSLLLNTQLDLRGRRDLESKNNRIRKMRLAAGDVMQQMAKDPDQYLNEMRQFCSKFTGVPGAKIFSCGAGIRNGCVDAYGRFQLCTMLRHPSTVYDLSNGSLKEALSDFVPKIRNQMAANPDYLKRCAQCALQVLCNQCPGKSWIEHGRLDAPVEYYCRCTHKQAEYLGLISKNEKLWEQQNSIEGRLNVA